MQAQAIRSPLGAFVRSPLGVRQTKVNEGYLYCVVFGSDYLMYLRKYNAATWACVWELPESLGDVFAGTPGILTDNLGNLYVWYLGYISKYSSSGVLQWSANHEAASRANGLYVDSALNVYIAGVDSGGYSARVYNKAGLLLLSVATGGDANGIAVDSSGNMYISGAAQSDGSTLGKYASNGFLVWRRAYGSSSVVRGIDNDENCVVTSGESARTYDSDGNTLVEFGVGEIRHAAVGPNGNLFVYSLSAIGEYDSVSGSAVNVYTTVVSAGIGHFCFDNKKGVYLGTFYSRVLIKFKRVYGNNGVGTITPLWYKTISDLDIESESHVGGIRRVAWSPT